MFFAIQFAFAPEAVAAAGEEHEHGRLFAASAGEIVSNAQHSVPAGANLQPFDLRRHEAAKLYAKPVMDNFCSLPVCSRLRLFTRRKSFTGLNALLATFIIYESYAANF